MFPLALPGLISGGASLLGSIFGSETSAQNTQAQIAGQERMQQESEQFNAGQAQQNRDFQQQMSSTAYQRSSADMKAAGLNPMMMFGSGGAASTPSGATASIGTPTMPTPQNKSPLAGLGDAVQSGLNATVTAKTLDKMTDEIANLEATRGKITAETDVATQQARKTNFEGTNVSLDTEKHRLGATTASDVLSMPDEIRKGIVRGEFQNKQFGGTVGGVVGSAKAAFDAAKRYLSNSGGDSFSDRYNAVYGNTGQ